MGRVVIIAITMLVLVGLASNTYSHRAAHAADPPAVTSITPNYGPAGGATQVTVAGAGFDPAQLETQFVGPTGDPALLTIECQSTTQCSASAEESPTPDGSVTQIQVRALVDGITGTVGVPFTWYGRPRLDQINPTSGPSSGGTVVWLTGGTFPGNATFPGPLPQVSFGGVPATNVNCTRTDGTVCGVHAPAGSGTVPVTITTPGGTSSSLSYTYTGPTVTGVTPNNGTHSGGTNVTITGSGFASDQQFQLADGATFTDVRCSSSTTCTAKTPAHSGSTEQAVPVATIAVGQTAQPPAAARFFYYDEPDPIEALFNQYVTNPYPGDQIFRIDVHTWFKIFASPLADGSSEAPGITRVQVHHTKVAPENVHCSHDNQWCIARTPNLGISFGSCTEYDGHMPVEIQIFTPGGQKKVTEIDYECMSQWVGDSATSPHPFPPHPSSPTGSREQPMQVDGVVTYNLRPVLSGTVEALVGRTVCGVGEIQYGRFALNVASSESVPGCGTNGDVVTFHVNGVPAEGSVPFSGGGNATVQLAVTGMSDLPSRPTPPSLPSTPGIPGLTGSAPPPTVTSVTPNYGPYTGGVAVTIAGANFASNQSQLGFEFNSGDPFTDVNCTSSTTCTARTPAMPAPPNGGATLIVQAFQQTGPNGPGFTIYTPPQLRSISPTSGPSSGGAVVTVTGGVFPNGTFFLGPAPQISFGGRPATNVRCTARDGTACTATVPSGSGTVQVTVTTPGGTSGSLPFTYTTPTGVPGRPGSPSLPLPSFPSVQQIPVVVPPSIQVPQFP